FASATYDIYEAGKCLALGRHVAGVFHLMRVLELGIGATRMCLHIPDPMKAAQRNWGAVLRKFDEEIKRRDRTQPPSWNHPQDRLFFPEVWASLDAVKNVWRNPTIHVGTKYTD